MFRFALLLSFLLTLNIGYSQYNEADFTWLNEDNKGIKQITVSKNNKIGIVQQFNQNGDPYFIKNSEFNGDKVIAIWYFHYDKNNQTDQIIFAHSNLGFEIDLYTRDKNVKETYTHLSKATEDYINSLESDSEDSTYTDYNDFSYLSEVRAINDTASLLKSKSYLELLERKVYLKEKTVFNDQQKIISQKTFNFKEKTESETTIKYQENKTIITFSDKTLGVKNVTTQTFDSQGNLIIESDNYRSAKYVYNDKKLTEKTIIEDKKVVSKTTYTYNGDLLVTEVFEDFENGRKYSSQYEYNEKDKLKTKTLERTEGKSQFKYEYLYW